MPFFSKEENEKIKSAIQTAEHETSGEIRVCVEKNCRISPIKRAGYFFRKLEMDSTTHHNGVLIYIAYGNRKFAIIGDREIHRHTGPQFWEDSKNLMNTHFKDAAICDGVIAAIKQVGHQLKEHFPSQKGDSNELPDDVYEAD